jgi:hypothetical protein
VSANDSELRLVGGRSSVLYGEAQLPHYLWRPGFLLAAKIQTLEVATASLNAAEEIDWSTEKYPIPRIPIGNGSGDLLLDVGSNWVRWAVSAAWKGWRVVGVGSSLCAVFAARELFRYEFGCCLYLWRCMIFAFQGRSISVCVLLFGNTAFFRIRR